MASVTSKLSPGQPLSRELRGVLGLGKDAVDEVVPVPRRRLEGREGPPDHDDRMGGLAGVGPEAARPARARPPSGRGGQTRAVHLKNVAGETVPIWALTRVRRLYYITPWTNGREPQDYSRAD
jgi:hypothetical protein